MIVTGYVRGAHVSLWVLKLLKGEAYEFSFKTTENAGCNSDR